MVEEVQIIVNLVVLVDVEAVQSRITQPVFLEQDIKDTQEVLQDHMVVIILLVVVAVLKHLVVLEIRQVVEVLVELVLRILL
jgi:hypothetical protein